MSSRTTAGKPGCLPAYLPRQCRVVQCLGAITNDVHLVCHPVVTQCRECELDVIGIILSEQNTFQIRHV